MSEIEKPTMPTENPSARCTDPDGFMKKYGTSFEREDDPSVSGLEIDSAIQRYYSTESPATAPAIRLPS